MELLSPIRLCLLFFVLFSVPVIQNTTFQSSQFSKIQTRSNPTADSGKRKSTYDIFSKLQSKRPRRPQFAIPYQLERNRWVLYLSLQWPKLFRVRNPRQGPRAIKMNLLEATNTWVVSDLWIFGAEQVRGDLTAFSENYILYLHHWLEEGRRPIWPDFKQPRRLQNHLTIWEWTWRNHGAKTSFTTPEAYFRKASDLFRKFPLDEWLPQPDDSQWQHADDLRARLTGEERFSERSFWLSCFTDERHVQLLYEVIICLNEDGSALVDCPQKMLHKRNKSCHEWIIYPRTVQ